MDKDKPAYRLICDAPSLDHKGRLVVKDWHGQSHVFRDHDKGLAFAAKLYQCNPKSIPAAKREPAARWSNPPHSIPWHYERHAFSNGVAIIRR